MASPASAKRPPPPLTSSPYPYAAAPDIIRAHQKDAYFQGVLNTQVTDLHRRLYGARSSHYYSTELRTFADLLYHSLTTLLGNRTLGEEYCDLVSVSHPTPLTTFLHLDSDPPSPGAPLLPSFPRRAFYILTSILLPYLSSRLLPSFRSALRRRLQSRLTHLTQIGHGTTKPTPSTPYRIQRYLLTHLSALTSGAQFHALVLASFYFTGAYYSLSKRLFGLRYIFTRRLSSESQGGRVGYEVLGLLLVIQLLVRGYLHIHAQLSLPEAADTPLDAAIRDRAFSSSHTSISLDENAYTTNNELLPSTPAGGANQRSLVEIGATTHTPVPKGGRARYDLGDKQGVMGWIKGSQQRKCTLCLEEMKDPAATQCGHVFCWVCIGDWIREKPECPLCRRQALAQGVLPLRGGSE